jgi:hypothetical protein
MLHLGRLETQLPAARINFIETNLGCMTHVSRIRRVMGFHACRRGRIPKGESHEKAEISSPYWDCRRKTRIVTSSYQA